MNKPLSLALLGLSLAMPLATLQAAEIPEALKSLEIAGQPANPSAIDPAPMDGWYEVRLRTGETLYTDAEANYLLVGELFENRDDQVKNLSAQQRRSQRQESLAELDEDVYVTYPADGEEKGEITVFTDISCPYCQQLHQDMVRLNAAGITVHYLPFPRQGLSTPVAQRMASIWCSKTPRQALNEAFNGQTAPVGDEAQACRSQLEQGYSLAQQFGVRGTPATVLPNGELGEGYRPVDQLVQAIGRATGSD